MDAGVDAALDLPPRSAAPKTHRQEVSLLASDGSILQVQLTINPIQLREMVVFCLVVTDLTEHKRHQELLSAAHRKDVEKLLAEIGYTWLPGEKGKRE